MRFDEADDSHWLASVIDQFEGPLVRYAQRITGDLEQARDAAQDTFLRLCREGRGAADGQMAQWLFTVCRHRAIDIRKKEIRMHSMTAEQAESSASRESPHSEAIEANDEAAKIAKLLAELPASQQEVVRLKFQEGLSYRDISTITGLTVTNVGYLLHVALKTVRERMVGGDRER